MSNVSIFEKKWIDVVFEDKNKEYGAYQLRYESPKTSAIALFLGISILIGLGGVFMLANSVHQTDGVENNVPIDRVIKIATVSIATPKNKKSEPKATPTVDNAQIPTNLAHLVVAKLPAEIEEIPKNSEWVNATNKTVGNPDNGEFKGTATTTNTAVLPTIDNSPKTTLELDKLPEFPGGIANFYNYVGTHFEKPELDLERTLTIYVSFIIEKDGSMSSVKVLRDPGYGLAKEAVRVLNALQTKWKPGSIGGEKVRTQYNLPIAIKTE